MRCSPLLVLAIVPIAACASAGPIAIPVGPAVSTAPGDVATSERFQTGRALFSARCQRCHALPVPTRLSPEAWPAAVVKMARKSGLSADQLGLVTDYLVAASRPGLRTD